MPPLGQGGGGSGSAGCGCGRWYHGVGTWRSWGEDVAWLGAGQEGPALREVVRLPFPERPSEIFLTPGGCARCCPGGAPPGSKDIEEPGMTHEAVSEEESDWEG